jgi:hypothetical protein
MQDPPPQLRIRPRYLIWIHEVLLIPQIPRHLDVQEFCVSCKKGTARSVLINKFEELLPRYTVQTAEIIIILKLYTLRR